MTTVDDPPIVQTIFKEDGKATIPWALFFQQLKLGDLGAEWTPTFQSLTEAGGAATITGRYYQLSANVYFFRINITPVTSTSATAGTTYCDNFPLVASVNGVCCSVSGNLGGSLGIIRASDSRIYVPTWTTVTDAVTILGIGEGVA